MTEHTPLPWTLVPDTDHRSPGIYSPKGWVTGLVDTHNLPEFQANAEFIVRACNSHDELLEACQEAHNYFLVLAEITQPEAMPEMVNILAEALSKARGV